MLNQSKIKYILASSVLFLLLFVTQYTPKKSMFFNKLENQINIINTFPDINPEKCLRSSKFFGGNSNKEHSFSCEKKQLKNFQCVVSCHVCTHQSFYFSFCLHYRCAQYQFTEQMYTQIFTLHILILSSSNQYILQNLT